MDVTTLIANLSSDERSVRAEAAEQLSRCGDAKSAAAALVSAAGDSDERVREWATAALEELGSPHAADVARLTELLIASAADSRYWAATLIGRLGPAASTAVPALVSALENDSETSVRERAAWALGEIGPAAKLALPALARVAADADQPRLQRLATEAAQRIQANR